MFFLWLLVILGGRCGSVMMKETVDDMGRVAILVEDEREEVKFLLEELRRAVIFCSGSEGPDGRCFVFPWM